MPSWALSAGAALGSKQIRRRALGGVAEHVHQEQPVLGGYIAGRPHGLGARVGVDPRHFVRGFAHDRHAGAGVSTLGGEPVRTPPGEPSQRAEQRRAGLGREVRVLVVGIQVGVGERPARPAPAPRTSDPG